MRSTLATITMLLITATAALGTRGRVHLPAAHDLKIPSVMWDTTNPEMRIALVGDLHGHFDAARALREGLARQNPDAIFLLGDNFGRCGVQSLADQRFLSVQPLASLGVPIFPVLGNHDYGDPHYRPSLAHCGDPDPQAQVNATARIPNWRMPARNYIVRSTLATFFFVDTTPIDLDLEQPFLGSATAAETYRWLERELPAVSGWKIVVGHHPACGSDAPRWKDLPSRNAMRRFGRFLEHQRVDLYVSGHQHHLELMQSDSGMRFLISGAAARPSTIAWTQPGPARTTFARGTEQGYATLDVSPSELSLQFVRADGSALTASVEIARRTAGPAETAK